MRLLDADGTLGARSLYGYLAEDKRSVNTVAYSNNTAGWTNIVNISVPSDYDSGALIGFDAVIHATCSGGGGLIRIITDPTGWNWPSIWGIGIVWPWRYFHLQGVCYPGDTLEVAGRAITAPDLLEVDQVDIFAKDVKYVDQDNSKITW